MILAIQKCFTVRKHFIKLNVFLFEPVSNFNFSRIHISCILDLVIEEWLIFNKVFRVFILLFFVIDSQILHIDELTSSEALPIERAQVWKGCLDRWSVRLGPAARIRVLPCEFLKVEVF